MIMEFKVPQNKPPFLGIRFRDSFTAAKTYSEIVDQFKKSTFHMIIEVTNMSVALKVIFDGPPLKVWKYYNVKCDLHKLQLFLAIRSDRGYSFAHIFKNRSGKDEVPKTVPLGNMFSIKISHITIHGEEYVR